MVTKTSLSGNGSDGCSYCSEGVTDYEGNHYSTVKIGNQCWMAENLKSTHYANGTLIADAVAYDNDEGNAFTYGRLYNWDAVMNGESSSNSNPSGVQGICPDGWHVPSDAEWMELEMTLGMTEVEADGLNNRGTHSEARKLKATEDVFLWDDDSAPGTNSSGFNALPAGFYAPTMGGFLNIELNTYFTTSTQEIAGVSNFIRHLAADNNQVRRFGATSASYISVRCVKD